MKIEINGLSLKVEEGDRFFVEEMHYEEDLEEKVQKYIGHYPPIPAAPKASYIWHSIFGWENQLHPEEKDTGEHFSEKVLESIYLRRKRAEREVVFYLRTYETVEVLWWRDDPLVEGKDYSRSMKMGKKREIPIKEDQEVILEAKEWREHSFAGVSEKHGEIAVYRRDVSRV